MGNISVGLITVDRSPAHNYLFDTFNNLTRSGFWKSPRLKSVHVCDSREESDWCLEAFKSIDPIVPIEYNAAPAGEFRTPTENAAIALGLAALEEPDWVLFLEDDIDVCGNFLDSVGDWLDDFARPDRYVYPFGAAYDAVIEAYKCGMGAWEYPIQAFYGTQAFAIRPEHAIDLSRYFLESHQHHGYDILMHSWAQNNWPDIQFFRTPVPSFVDHIGRESVIAPRPKTHSFQAFAGYEYSYQSKVRV